ncbi:hypothetical protein ACLOJK_004895, partial [Asimina triloba]
MGWRLNDNLHVRHAAGEEMDLSLPYYYSFDHGREVMMGAELGIEMTLPARILWIDLARALETFMAAFTTSLVGWVWASTIFFFMILSWKRYSFRCESLWLGAVPLLLGQ